MITSYMIFVNQKYYAWLLFFLTNSGTNLTRCISTTQSRYQSCQRLLFISLTSCNWSHRKIICLVIKGKNFEANLKANLKANL